MRRRVSASLLLAVGLAGCGDDLPDPGVTGRPGSSSSSTGDGSLDATTGPGTTGGSTTEGSTTEASTTTGDSLGGNTFGELDECQRTSECPAGLYCVAPFDESLGPEGKGLNECVAECVGIMDEARWCADVEACCDPTAECTDRGYCVYPHESTGGTETGGSGSSTGER